MPDPPGRALPSGASLMALALMSACSMMPPGVEAEERPAVPVRVAALSQQVSITGAGGRDLDGAQRNAEVRRVAAQGRPALMKAQLAAMARYGDVDLYAGNQVRLLIDGPETFRAMFAAVRGAKRSILLESYIFEDAKLARELATLLKARRADGLEVSVMFDAVGSIGTDQAFFDDLRAAGVGVCKFNPLNPLERLGSWGISHRDHRKILVTDDALAFTGGINISSVYSSGSAGFGSKKKRQGTPSTEDGWRDTQIEIHGPAATALGKLVRQTWRDQGCKPEPREPAAAPAVAPGGQLVRVIPSSPDEERNRIYELLITAIRSAQDSVKLTMAYFSPGDEMIDALKAAARRGVAVQLILPSVSDFTPVLDAGRASYAELLEAGVEIHELQTAVLHAKTAVIDGVVSTVGSSNMDWRSFADNNEVNAVVIGEDFGARMSEVFRQDLAASQGIDARVWAQRPLWQRVREHVSRLFERLW